MVKKDYLKNALTIMMVAAMSVVFYSCGSDDEELDDGSHNTVDVAVTSNVSKLGVTYVHIDGYVNLNLITASYTNQQIGVELSMNEDFDNPKRAVSKSLEGNKLTVTIDTLSAQTKYYYRTYVKVNDLNYYGEKRSFITKDFSNITSTGEVSSKTFTSAIINCKADVASLDRDNNYAIGVAYSTKKNQLHPDSAYSGYYDWNGDYVTKGFYTTTYPLDSVKNKSYESTISKLQTGTTYYYCSFTRAGNKYKLGEIKSFTTESLSASQLSTGDATDITFTSATIKNTSTIASLYPQGTYISYGIRYATTKEALEYAGYNQSASIDGNTFTVSLRNLSPGTEYYYYAYVSVEGIVFTGETKKFTTKSGNTYLTTEDATDVTLTSATLNGKTTLSSLYANNASSIRYTIRYSRYSDYINDPSGYYGGYSSTTPTQNGNELSATLTNLQSNTTYYFCVTAYIDGYYICGDIKSFTTKSGADYLKTEEASDITLTSASLKGSTTLSAIYSSNTSIQYHIRYATSSSYLTSSYNSSSVAVTKNGNNLMGTATNLKSETTYYYCVVAYVDGTYIYGETKSFTTKSGADYLKAGESNNVTITSATVKGITTLESIYSNSSSIQYRILYGTSSNLQTSSTSTATPERSGNTLTAELTNLTMATTYYYCIRAYVDGNYIYSDTKSFTTKDIQTTGYVDLEVSCKWAACNLGATVPEGYGDYYAWGETETRTFFYSSNYSYYRENIGTDISDTNYDAAKKVLGSPWRMPTGTEFQELLDKCFWKEITYKNTTGYLVTGKNGNAIFLPKTGYKEDNSTRSGYAIWTSTYYNYSSSYATSYAKYWAGSTLSYTFRYYGLTIRPVRD